jgi:hypothetical protein
MTGELRPAVAFLGAALILAVVGITALAFAGKPIPDVLSSLALADLTGLAALLRPASAGSGPAERSGGAGAHKALDGP